MITKPSDYETAASYDSDVSRLPAGCYVCKVLKMEEAVAQSGKQMVVMYYDIAEGEHAGYYDQQYKREKQSSSEAKWRGKYYLFPYTKDGFTNPSFKGALTCIEKSNMGFKVIWPLNFDMFKGKLIGLLFREEDVLWEGRVITTVRPCAARTVDDIRNDRCTIPKKKELNNGQGGQSANAQSVYSTQEFTPTTVDTDELPF